MRMARDSGEKKERITYKFSILCLKITLEKYFAHKTNSLLGKKENGLKWDKIVC